MDAFVFDAYGTLFDVHSVVRRCDAFWPGKGAALSQAWRTKQLEYTWLRSLMGRYVPFSQVTREALAWSLAFLKLEKNEKAIDALMQEYLRLDTFPDVKETLAKLKDKRLAILSNGSPDMLDPVVAHADLRLDAVLSVDALKVYKPAPAVYQLAVEKLKVADRSAITFVSSNCWDAIGAKSFGFRVFWINRAGAPLDRLGFEPDGVLSTLGDLPVKE
jgi:2-haloacid dehalogenase